MSNDHHIAIILAGGNGSRMNMDLPKVCCLINGKPMIIHILETVMKTQPTKIFVILGKSKDIVTDTITQWCINETTNIKTNIIEYIIQSEQLGTGHALLCCIPSLHFYNNYRAIILCGDVPLISDKTLNKMLTKTMNSQMLVTHKRDPSGMGRVKTSSLGNFLNIIEEKDCTDRDKNIQLVNGGIYVLKCVQIIKYCPLIKNDNSQKEYYLPEIFKIIQNHHEVIELYVLPVNLQFQIEGVNTQKQLKNVEIIHNTIHSSFTNVWGL